MQKLRIASVAYLNALPLTWGLSHGRDRDRVALINTPPFRTADLLREGRADIALMPSVEFARTGGLETIPGTGIAAEREVRSVILLTRCDPTSIRTLAVDLNSRTSVALARIVLSRRYSCRPALEPMPPDPEAMLASHDAALVIGDAALRSSLHEAAAPPTRTIDLAGEWHDLTGLPFVFAFWACRPVIDIASAGRMLERSLKEGLSRFEEIARAESERAGLPEEMIVSYLRNNIRYRIGPKEIESLRVFFGLCREEGLLPASPPPPSRREVPRP